MLKEEKEKLNSIESDSMSKKSPEKKARLRRARKKAKPVPLFVRLKTARRVMSTPARRHWREKKLKIKV